MLSIQQNIITDFNQKKLIYQKCILEKKNKECFKSDSSILDTEKIQTVLQNYNNGSIDFLQFVTTIIEDKLYLQLHKNNINDTVLNKEIVSVLIDINYQITNKIKKCKEKLQKNNQTTIVYLLNSYNKQYKIKQGLSLIPFEDLGLEKDLLGNIENETEKKELQNIKKNMMNGLR